MIIIVRMNKFILNKELLKTKIHEATAGIGWVEFVVYFVPLVVTLPIYGYGALYYILVEVLDFSSLTPPHGIFYYTRLVLQLFGEPSYQNILGCVWVTICILPVFIFVFHAYLLTPLIIFAGILWILAKPFKEEFLEELGEFLLGLGMGATLFLIFAILSENPTRIRLIGGLIGFTATIAFMVYGLAS